MERIHLIGIGGTGLSAIAKVLLERGYTVTGSDLQDSPLAQAVEKMGARVHVGHQAEQVEGADIVVRSSAIPDENVEVQAARARGIPVLKRAEFLGKLLEGYQVIAVAGTHGKTSTTAMIAWMLMKLGQDPSFIVGSVIQGLGTNARAGKGEYFVIEADEYDRMFLGLNPDLAVVTNVEHDHPDCYPTPEAFQDAFRRFVGRLTPKGILLACGDAPETLELGRQAEDQGNRFFTYGLRGSSNDYGVRNLSADSERGGYLFEGVRGEKSIGRVAMQVPGEHNVQNALAALAVADLLQLSPSGAGQALSTFRGTQRRFEVIGESQGVIVVSDYAHHPTEIRATLAAARSRYPGSEIWAIWQPHTYSRTRLLMTEFAAAFEDAHHVVVTEVYPAREPVELQFSARKVLKAMGHADGHFLAELADVPSFLASCLRPGDVCLVLSAGDAHQICNPILDELKRRKRQPRLASPKVDRAPENG